MGFNSPPGIYCCAVTQLVKHEPNMQKFQVCSLIHPPSVSRGREIVLFSVGELCCVLFSVLDNVSN